MTIREIISANIGRQIRIGFASSFVYADTASEDTFKEMEIITKHFHDVFNTQLKYLNYALNDLLKKGEEKYVVEMLERQEKEHTKRFEANYYRQMYRDEIASRKKSIAGYQFAVDNFVPFLDAEVSETLEALDEDALVVISKDNKRVIGAFWFCDEYRRAKAKGKYW